jgi:hypothetical protein
MQAAAFGGKGRQCPREGDWKSGRCNFCEVEINRTSPVCIFRQDPRMAIESAIRNVWLSNNFFEKEKSNEKNTVVFNDVCTAWFL